MYWFLYQDFRNRELYSSERFILVTIEDLEVVFFAADPPPVDLVVAEELEVEANEVAEVRLTKDLQENISNFISESFSAGNNN